MWNYLQGDLSALEGDKSDTISLKEYIGVCKSYDTGHPRWSQHAF